MPCLQRRSWPNWSLHRDRRNVETNAGHREAGHWRLSLLHPDPEELFNSDRGAVHFRAWRPSRGRFEAHGCETTAGIIQPLDHNSNAVRQRRYVPRDFHTLINPQPDYNLGWKLEMVWMIQRRSIALNILRDQKVANPILLQSVL